MDYNDFEEMVCPTCNGARGFYYAIYDPPDPCDECCGYGIVPDFNRPKKKGNTMNYSSAVMLINPNIRAIKCSYEPAQREGQKPTSYIFKALDKDIKVGDYVIVPTDTRWEQTVNRVEEVDVEVDFDSTLQLKWIIGRVPKEQYDVVLAEEAKWIEALKESEKRKKREEIKKNLVDMYQDAGIDKMPIANMGGIAAIEHKQE